MDNEMVECSGFSSEVELADLWEGRSVERTVSLLALRWVDERVVDSVDLMVAQLVGVTVY